MDKQREDFEAWVREYGNYPRRPELKTSDGAYHYLHTESEWRAWQAAQAAQPVTKAAPVYTGSQLKQAVRDAIEEVAKRVEVQRNDIPANGFEFAAAIRALIKEIPE